MNLLVINPSVDLYGSNRILANTLIFLQKEHKITLILPSDGPFKEFLEQKGVKVEVIIYSQLPIISRGMFSFSGMVELIQNYRQSKILLKTLQEKHAIDLVYVNTQSALFFLRICKNRVPNVLHVHEIVENPALVAKFINRKSLKWADKIIAVSEPVKGNLLKYAPVRFSYKVEVVLNGIEDVFGGEGRGLNNEGRSKIVITLIGRIKPEKGIWFFLDAIAALSDEVARRCIFNIVGSAAPNGESWVEKLRSDIEHHKFKENIKYTSFITDVSDIQKEADILVVPSLMRDPFPTTVLEAMAAGKPVIATNNGGAVQAISHGETGYLIAPGDIKQFAAYMEQLIENKDLRNSLGLNGRKTYASRFTMKEFEASFLKTFLTR